MTSKSQTTAFGRGYILSPLTRLKALSDSFTPSVTAFSRESATMRGHKTGPTELARQSHYSAPDTPDSEEQTNGAHCSSAECERNHDAIPQRTVVIKEGKI